MSTSDSDNPWKLTAKRTVYSNPWISVEERDVTLTKTGHQATYGITSTVHGVCVLPLDSTGNVHLARQYRLGMQGMSVEGPGGAIDAGESPLEAAERELLEEMGIRADTWTDLGYVCPLTGILDHREYLFLAEDFDVPTETPHQDDEQIELLTVSLAEAVEMAIDGRIVHAPSATR